MEVTTMNKHGRKTTYFNVTEVESDKCLCFDGDTYLLDEFNEERIIYSKDNGKKDISE